MADITSTQLLDLIHSQGFWRVHLRPTLFEEARLRSKAYCRGVVYDAAVSHEGWQYPIVNDQAFEEGSDWTAGAADSSVFIEYWRLYQSGQFIHHLAIREDHMGRLGLFHPQYFMPGKDQRFLAVTSTICMITNIMEFAARLAYKEILMPRAVVTIELHRMASRGLAYMLPSRRLPNSYWFKTDMVRLEGAFDTEELIGRSRDIAADFSLELFRRAGWDPPRSVIVDDQPQYRAAAD